MTTVGLGWHINSPTLAPTVAQGSSTGGLVGSYQYAITFVNGNGETTLGPASGSVSITGSTTLTGIQVGIPGVFRRNIYRTAAGGTVFRLVTTIADDVATMYTDALADGSLGAVSPVINTADSVQVINGYTSLSQPISYSYSSAITAVASGTQPVLNTEHVIISTCPLGGQVTLMPLASAFLGLTINIRNNGANPCLINPSSGDTVNGVASLALANGAYVRLFASSATNWVQIY